jgi:serine/threonine protein kinase
LDTLIGQTIAHYKILVKIREDATGTVYKAQDTEADRFVAIKTLSPSISANPERRQRVERDAMAASALEHPNIARVFEFSRAGDVEFAVMEAPEGDR